MMKATWSLADFERADWPAELGKRVLAETGGQGWAKPQALIAARLIIETIGSKPVACATALLVDGIVGNFSQFAQSKSGEAAGVVRNKRESASVKATNIVADLLKE